MGYVAQGNNARKELKMVAELLDDEQGAALAGLCNCECTLPNLIMFRERIRSVMLLRQKLKIADADGQEAREALGL